MVQSYNPGKGEVSTTKTYSLKDTMKVLTCDQGKTFVDPM
jgi:hypothetical protein